MMRKAVVSLIMLIVTACVFGLILGSPLLLSHLGARDWNRLSQIGQTYGAASAIISALALGGVAVSLFVQAGQARAHQIQIVREYQLRLVQIVLDDPDIYLPCWRPIELPGLNLDGKRQHLFITLRINYALMGYEIGVISERGLRGDTLAGIFKGTAGREYWEETRRFWLLRTGRNRQTRQFLRIVDDEYAKAIKAGPPIQGRVIGSQFPPISRNGDKELWRKPLRATFLGIGTGIFIGILLRRQRHY
jgi:hypothetical protein